MTHYRYDRAVELSPQLVRLRPAPHCRTPILSYSQRVTPAGHFLNWQQDPQSNYVARLDVSREGATSSASRWTWSPRWRSTIRSTSSSSHHAEQFPFAYETGSCRELQPFLHAEPLTPRLADYLDTHRPRAAGGPIDLLVDVNRKLQRDIRYVIRLDPGVQDVEQTLELASARAATRRGCSCSCSATSGWRRDSCRAT